MMKCSFCGRLPEEYPDIIQGPKVAICYDCLEVCVGILFKNLRRKDGLIENLEKLIHLHERGE